MSRLSERECVRRSARRGTTNAGDSDISKIKQKIAQGLTLTGPGKPTGPGSPHPFDGLLCAL